MLFRREKKYRSVEKMPARHAEKCGGSKAPSLRGVHLIEWKTLSFSGFSEEKDRSTFVRLLGKYLLDKLLTVVAHRKSRISEPRGVFLSFFFFFCFFFLFRSLYFTRFCSFPHRTSRILSGLGLLTISTLDAILYLRRCNVFSITLRWKT